MSLDSNNTVRDKPIIDNDLTMKAYRECQVASLQSCEYKEGKLVWENKNGLVESFKDGFFFLKIPSEINLEALDMFCKSFYLHSDRNECLSAIDYKNIEVPGDYQGYFNRPHDQWENFYIERNNWKLLPEKVRESGEILNEFAQKIFDQIIISIGIPCGKLEVSTGGLSQGGGHRMLAFNHFRKEQDKRGCKFHRDSGWLTILRMDQPGLLIYKDNKYQSVIPNNDFFVVNYGSTLEVLTQTSNNPVKSVIHGVVNTSQLSTDRHSYVLFMDSDLNGDIYQLQDDTVVPVQSMVEFAMQETSRTYDNKCVV